MKIALINNDDFSMYHFRRGLIKQLINRGIEATIVVPPGRFVRCLEGLGSRCIPIPMNRFFSPIEDLRLIRSLYKLFKEEKFDIVHNMTIKPNIYGTLAAKMAGIKRRVGLVAGAGFIFLNGTGWMPEAFRLPAMLMYKVAMAMTDKVWFQNRNDLETFVRRGLINREKTVLIRGSGVDLTEFSPSSIDTSRIEEVRRKMRLPRLSHCVLMVAARMVWSKGVKEFVEAAYSLNDSFKEWYFVMICPKDQGTPDSVPDAYLSSSKLDQLIILDKFRYDIRDFMALADIIVLPSYYPEGVPRSLLEALAMGKPIVTTDHQGCRETVEEGKNGFLIPIKDSASLIEKLSVLMEDGNLRKRFGEYSRKKAELEFDEEMVAKRICRELYGLSDRSA